MTANLLKWKLRVEGERRRGATPFITTGMRVVRRPAFWYAQVLWWRP